MEIEIYKMTFKIQKEMKILRILGEDFQENNRNKGKLVINNKKYTLQNVIPINNSTPKTLKLVLSKDIYNKSSMFKNCESLSKLLLDNDKEKFQNNDIINEDEYYLANFENSKKENSSYNIDNTEDEFFNYYTKNESKLSKI